MVAQIRVGLEGSDDVLRGSDVGYLEDRLNLLDEDPVLVASVVQVPPGKGVGQHVGLFDSLRSELVKNFMVDVLSGKLPHTPPMRGHFGEARINLVPGATPKRHRSFKMVGEREAALKKIIEEYNGRGWLEPSFSE